MSKGRLVSRKNSSNKSARNPGRKVCGLLLIILLSGLMITRMMSADHSLWGLLTNRPPQTTSSTPLILSKEYIYAGGQLVAIEDAPTIPLITGPAPTSLTASADESRTRIKVSWSPPSSGQVDHYEIERKGALSSQILTTTDAAQSLDDSVSSSPVVTYLYRVRAVFVGGGLSEYSNPDIATNAVFSDDPLNASVGTRTLIKARHFTELRDVINAVRATAGLTPFNWTGPKPQSGGSISASHLNDLRANLREGFRALGLPPPSYEAPDPITKGEPVKATNINQLRGLLK